MKFTLSIVRKTFTTRSKYQRNLVIRAFSSCPSPPNDEEIVYKKGLLLGAYESNSSTPILTKAAQSFNERVSGRLLEKIVECGEFKKGAGHLLENISSEFSSIAVVGIGTEERDYKKINTCEERSENIKEAASLGVRCLREAGVNHILVDEMGYPEYAAEGSAKAFLKLEDSYPYGINSLELFESDEIDAWSKGIFRAETENLAEKITHPCGRQMTPAMFAQATVEALWKCGVNLQDCDKDWIEMQLMNTFHTVARTATTSPMFLELNYSGCSTQADKPVVLVGVVGKYLPLEGENQKFNATDDAKNRIPNAAVVMASIRPTSPIVVPTTITAVVPFSDSFANDASFDNNALQELENVKSIAVNVKASKGLFPLYIVKIKKLN